MARIFKASRSSKPKASQKEKAPDSLTIVDLASDGRGVARHQGKAVFVAGALPGEEVEVMHYRRHKQFSECQTKAVIKASAQRVEPFCRHYDLCGGCQLQHLATEYQLSYKQKALISMLERQHNIVPKRLLGPIHSSDQGYRHRVRFGVSRDSKLAFRALASDQLVAIEHCPVLANSLSLLLPMLQDWLATLGDKPGVTHIELIAAEPKPAVVIRHLKPLDEQTLGRLKTLEANAFCWLQPEKKGPLYDLSGELVNTPLSYRLPEYQLRFEFEPGDFTQVNSGVNQQMVEQAIQWLEIKKDDDIADLFCGVGNFTLPIARFAHRVFAIEAEEGMVARGRHNARLNDLNNIDFRGFDLNTQALTQVLDREECKKVLLDPPRAGAKFVCEQIARSAVERVIYVSCNPASFARDSRLLVDAGFDLIELRALDMFPQTAHLETMALFVRAA